MSDTFILAACAEMLWRDRPMEWRLSRLTELGFQAGIWNWQAHDLAMLERSGAVFSSMTGYVRGRLADEEGAAELIATARQSIEIGKRLNVARLNLHGTGLGEGGLPVTPCQIPRKHAKICALQYRGRSRKFSVNGATRQTTQCNALLIRRGLY